MELDVDVMKLAEELFWILRDSVKELWKKEDTEFLKKLATDMATQKALAQASDNPEEHLQNLHHLVATTYGEAVRKTLKIRRFQREKFLSILIAVAKTVAIPLLKAQLEKR